MPRVPHWSSLLGTLLARNLRASFVSTAAALSLLFTFFSLGVYLYTTFGATNRDAMSSISPEFLIAFFGGLLGGFEPVDLWLVTLYAHPLLIVVLTVSVVGPVIRDLSGEIDRGTLDLLLGCPVPRWVLVLAVWIAGQVALGAVALVLWSAGQVGALTLGVEAKEGIAMFAALPRYQPVILQFWLLGQAVLGVSIWFSARESLYGKALAKTLSFLIFSYFLNLLAGLWSAIASLRWLSIFHYYAPQPILAGNSQVLERSLLVAFSLALVVGALRHFQRRDIAGV